MRSAKEDCYFELEIYFWQQDPECRNIFTWIGLVPSPVFFYAGLFGIFLIWSILFTYYSLEELYARLPPFLPVVLLKVHFIMWNSVWPACSSLCTYYKTLSITLTCHSDLPSSVYRQWPNVDPYWLKNDHFPT